MTPLSRTPRRLRVEHLHLPRVRAVPERRTLRLPHLSGHFIREEDALHHATGVRGRRPHTLQERGASRSQTGEHTARRRFQREDHGFRVREGTESGPAVVR